MFIATNIMLAKGDGASQIISVLVLLAMVIIGHFAKKASEKRRIEEAEERRRQRQLHEQQNLQEQARTPQQEGASRREPAPQPQAMPAPPVQMHVQEQLAALNIVQERPTPLSPRPPVQAKPPPEPQPTARRTHSRRQPRVIEAETAKSRIGVLRSRLDVAPATVTKQDAADVSPVAALGVDLSSRELLRNAIVYHEIFSPPKAMRQEREIWDT